MRRLAATVSLVALALTGCSAGETKIDAKKAEDLGRKVADSGRIRLKSITCPSDVAAKAGKTFDCDLAYEDGATGTITMHMTDDEGNVRTRGTDIHVQK